jgi:hypothetical protein
MFYICIGAVLFLVLELELDLEFELKCHQSFNLTQVTSLPW